MDGTPPTWAHADPCASHAPAQCYGEVAPEGVSRLVHLLPSASSRCAVRRTGDVLYDVGSGFGRVCAQLVELTNASVAGIEVNACRVAAARRAFAGFPLLLREGDVRDVGFTDATHLVLTSQCWDRALLRAIFGRLARRAPRLRCIVDVGSADALVAQDIVGLASAFGTVSAIAPDVTGTWDARAAALFITRGARGDDDGRGRDDAAAAAPCNRSCVGVRRARRWLESVAREVEASDLPGPLSPWRRPPPLLRARAAVVS